MEQETNNKPRRTLRWTAILITLAVIAILAAIAIPDFLHFSERARQSWPKTNLASIATAEWAYFSNTGSWSGSFEVIGWRGESHLSYHSKDTKYTYFLTPTEWLGSNPNELGIKVPFQLPGYKGPMPGYSANGFTAVAVGNMDNDSTLDIWYINKEKNPVNVVNDVNE